MFSSLIRLLNLDFIHFYINIVIILNFLIMYTDYEYDDITEYPSKIINKVGYGYSDLTIVPASLSGIMSRSECSVYDDNGMLPIFTAPMMDVVNERNFHIWGENKVYAIAPRTINYMARLRYLNNELWAAFSFKEFTKLFVNLESDKFNPIKGHTYKVCIDMANGHSAYIYTAINIAKELARKNGYTLTIMVGNIAFAETYRWICDNAEVDYVRVSIGSGANCLTASNPGVHYPIASLINECHMVQQEMIDDMNDCGPEFCHIAKSIPYIVADGGIKGYADINKALALGADYVMIGSIFAGLLESAADMLIQTHIMNPTFFNKDSGIITWYENSGRVEHRLNIWDSDTPELIGEKRSFLNFVDSVTRRTFGMSTKEAQMAIAEALEEPIHLEKGELKTSEGCTKWIDCKYTIKQWLENAVDYLKSAMSYCNSKTLKEFKQTAKLIPNSPGELHSVNK